jgi:DNA repair protein RadC
MTKRYIDSEGAGFSNHELLELLLFYGRDRVNTNEIAHQLFERFGSINRMAEASVDELKLVRGIGDNSAALIKLVLSLAKEYAKEFKSLPSKIDNIEKAVEYANQHTMGAIKELVYAIFMDDNFNVIDTNLIASGTVNAVKPMMRTLFEYTIVKRATNIILFHNHPLGGVEPSDADIEFTFLLKNEIETIGARLIEHLIVDGKDYFPIIKNYCDT